MRLKSGLLIVLAGLVLLGGDAAPRRLILAFLGDIMLGRGVAEAHSAGDWQGVFLPLEAQLNKADFILANLESPVCVGDALVDSNKTGGGYVLRAPEEGLIALRRLGQGIFSLANNHNLDCGPEGVAATAASLKQIGMRPLIEGKPAVTIDTMRGKLAFLAFDDVTAGLDVEEAARAVSEARQAGATVIVSLHWGLEYQPGANERQRRQAQALADAGAAIIWGHHPHVLQPPGWVQGRGQSHPTLVLYSLGNALFDQHAPPDAKRSAMIVVEFDGDSVVDLEVYPFEIDARRGRVVAASHSNRAVIMRRLSSILSQ